MNTILYTTDFSENSENALKYACELSQKTGATLVALHVHDIPSIMASDEPTFPDIQRDVMEKNKEKLQRYCKTLSGNKKIRFEAKENKSSVKGIISMIDEINADLVVMGTKGKSKVHELVMGSTSMGVIKKAGCPVLTVPAEGKFGGFSHLVYATEFEESDIQIINWLSEIAGIFDAEITVIHVSSKHDGEEIMENYKNRILENISYPKLKFKLLLSDDIYAGLNKYLIENKIELIAMMEHEDRSIFEKWFHRDMVKQMEFHVTIPLLTFNQKYLIENFKKEDELIIKNQK
jgi:nucleotide-binding universal stress UspA family protein